MHLDIGIQRARRNRWIRGVCAGIAYKMGVDPLWVRLAFIVAAVIVPGVSLISVIVIYVLLGIALPERDTL
jgi:phage shock protein PspC (stress-responsive transcriptional regulator)